jgi:hypothetical protein
MGRAFPMTSPVLPTITRAPTAPLSHQLRRWHRPPSPAISRSSLPFSPYAAHFSHL